MVQLRQKKIFILDYKPEPEPNHNLDRLGISANEDVMRNEVVWAINHFVKAGPSLIVNTTV